MSRARKPKGLPEHRIASEVSARFSTHSPLGRLQSWMLSRVLSRRARRSVSGGVVWSQAVNGRSTGDLLADGVQPPGGARGLLHRFLWTVTTALIKPIEHFGEVLDGDAAFVHWQREAALVCEHALAHGLAAHTDTVGRFCQAYEVWRCLDEDCIRDRVAVVVHGALDHGLGVTGFVAACQCQPGGPAASDQGVITAGFGKSFDQRFVASLVVG